MREILFRGKCSITGKWVVGNYMRTIIGGKDVDLIVPICGFADLAISQKIYQIDPETLGQFTGLTDKNGMKIFDGDICRGAWGTPFEVFWDRGHTAIRHELPYGQDIYYYASFDDNKISAEIIGNIHDNPELLEVNK